MTLGFGIEASVEGHVEAWKSLKLEEYDEARGIDVVALWARSIAGRVLDADGRSIPGTTIQLWYGSESTWPTTVDAEGRFKTPARAPRKTFELIVEAPGYARRTIPIPAGAGDPTEVGDVVFRRRGRVAGVVVDADGRPVGNLWLVLDHVADKTTPPSRARTDAAGRFEFRDVGEDRATIFVDGLDGSLAKRRTYRGALRDVEPGRVDVRFEVRAETAVTLRFVGANGRDPVNVKSAEYGLRYAGTPEPEHLGQTATSEPLSAVSLSVESGRRYDLTVRAAGFVTAHRDGVEVGDLAGLELCVPMRPTGK